MEVYLPLSPSNPEIPFAPLGPEGPGLPDKPFAPFTPSKPGRPELPFDPFSPVSPGKPKMKKIQDSWKYKQENLTNNKVNIIIISEKNQNITINPTL